MKTYKALQKGFMDGDIKEPNQVFSTAAPAGKWMEEVDPVTLKPVSSAPVIEAEEDEKRGKRGAK